MHRSKQATAYHASGIAQGGEPFLGLLRMIAQPARPDTHTRQHRQTDEETEESQKEVRIPVPEEVSKDQSEVWVTLSTATRRDSHPP